ncbi:hypothetical protein Zmor_009356 [Zophobas morio]|uniref:Methyltransferase domain-containing protein n=1 Tax=Zophobas morio TaxID=2755281 RepID=A0AA38MIK9_9CUCU|nr:hypothetical protein Zmor_009356 [Zophobas morio]
MNEDPVQYSKSCQLQLSMATHFLDTYFNLLNVKNNATILDLGAGDASVTLEALLPRLPNFNKLVVCDKSRNMVNFAKNRFHDERIETVQMDIIDYDKSLKGYFDHIFSFLCLQQIPEDRTPEALRNIFEMLKPGGNIFSTLVVDVCFYEIWETMVKEKKWPPAMAGFKSIIPSYRSSDNPREKLMFLLKNAGFDVQVCNYEKRKFTYDGLNEFMDHSLSIIPILKIGSQDERTKFLEDFKEAVRKCSLLRIDSTSDGGQVHYFYSVLVACALKPV